MVRSAEVIIVSPSQSSPEDFGILDPLSSLLRILSWEADGERELCLSADDDL
jgi:hypothetical protein